MVCQSFSSWNRKNKEFEEVLEKMLNFVIISAICILMTITTWVVLIKFVSLLYWLDFLLERWRGSSKKEEVKERSDQKVKRLQKDIGRNSLKKTY